MESRRELLSRKLLSQKILDIGTKKVSILVNFTDHDGSIKSHTILFQQSALRVFLSEESFQIVEAGHTFNFKREWFGKGDKLSYDFRNKNTTSSLIDVEHKVSSEPVPSGDPTNASLALENKTDKAKELKPPAYIDTDSIEEVSEKKTEEKITIKFMSYVRGKKASPTTVRVSKERFDSTMREGETLVVFLDKEDRFAVGIPRCWFLDDLTAPYDFTDLEPLPVCEGKSMLNMVVNCLCQILAGSKDHKMDLENIYCENGFAYLTKISVGQNLRLKKNDIEFNVSSKGSVRIDLGSVYLFFLKSSENDPNLIIQANKEKVKAEKSKEKVLAAKAKSEKAKTDKAKKLEAQSAHKDAQEVKRMPVEVKAAAASEDDSSSDDEAQEKNAVAKTPAKKSDSKITPITENKSVAEPLEQAAEGKWEQVKNKKDKKSSHVPAKSAAKPKIATKKLVENPKRVASAAASANMGAGQLLSTSDAIPIVVATPIALSEPAVVKKPAPKRAGLFNQQVALTPATSAPPAAREGASPPAILSSAKRMVANDEGVPNIQAASLVAIQDLPARINTPAKSIVVSLPGKNGMSAVNVTPHISMPVVSVVVLEEEPGAAADVQENKDNSPSPRYSGLFLSRHQYQQEGKASNDVVMEVDVTKPPRARKEGELELNYLRYLEMYTTTFARQHGLKSQFALDNTEEPGAPQQNIL